MYIGISLVLIAVGAILTWAVNFDIGGIEVNTVGIILMVVGVIGIAASVAMGRRGAADDRVIR